MRRRSIGLFLALSAAAPVFAGALPSAPVFAGLAPLLRTASAQAAPGGTAAGQKWYDRINLSGLLAGEGRWRRTGDDGSAATASDLYLRAFEIGIEGDLSGWASATVVLNSEWIGDSLNGGDGGVVVDEAHLDIALPGTPVYFVVGKRTQPFGLFETHFVTDPLVQDGFETKVVGLTAGIKAAGATDLGLTLYKGHVQSDQLAQSGLLGPDTAGLPEQAVALVESWVLSGISSPAGEAWSVFAALASEPGSRRRQTTVDAGTHLELPGLKNIELDVEYVKALRRDDAPGLGRPFLEAALSITASYQFMPRKRAVLGGGNYRARRSHRRAHPIEAAVRFEAFDDGSRAAVLGTWSARNRISLGGRYTFFEKGGVLAAADAEYRRQAVRVSPAFAGSAGASQEVYIRIGLDF
jgi:hypothetical protein